MANGQILAVCVSISCNNFSNPDIGQNHEHSAEFYHIFNYSC